MEKINQIDEDKPLFFQVGTIKKSTSGHMLRIMVFKDNELERIYYSYTLDMEAYLRGERQSVRIFQRRVEDAGQRNQEVLNKYRNINSL